MALLQREGLPQVLARHRLLAGLVHAAVEGWREGGALDFFARDPASRSAAVTTVTVPPGTDVDALRALAREDFQVAFAGALGPLHGRGFRIGHLGDQNAAGVLGCLAVVEAALRVQGIPVGAGGMQRAVMALAQLERAAPPAHTVARTLIENARPASRSGPRGSCRSCAVPRPHPPAPGHRRRAPWPCRRWLPGRWL